MPSSLHALQEALGYHFQDQALLSLALTHASAGEGPNYERLEFLGDRVLALIIADFVFKTFPNEAEGDLAKRLASLVQGATLAQVALRLDLGAFMALSASERESGGAQNAHILADVLEAVIGAMYLDGGYGPCRALVERYWQDLFHTMKTPPQHPKTEIQELLQARGLPLPVYEISAQSGPDHAPVFEVRLSVQGYAPLLAQGRTRAEAEKNAARIFLEQHKPM